MTDAAAKTEATALAEGPVQGPAAPAYGDLVWATGTTAATMADPGAALAQREAAAEAEQAAYIAARHLGPTTRNPTCTPGNWSWPTWNRRPHCDRR